ncbi:TetR family transcriptional regulator [Streptomyces sp. NPDC006283]|uniref:TetR/AcrR family transcriptional regulator n=1 Tax=Streptomyces sp. NPDC006283 TaxID=3156741 RepID=UPI0033B2FB5E
MRHNPQRRTALLDAAIEVLAREGSRGLTLRAVDAEAGVPVGTCSNYFANRAQLLRQIMQRTRERLTPDPVELADTLTTPPTHRLVARLLRQVHERMEGDRSSYLAMLELRLEGARRPGAAPPGVAPSGCALHACCEPPGFLEAWRIAKNGMPSSSAPASAASSAPPTSR